MVWLRGLGRIAGLGLLAVLLLPALAPWASAVFDRGPDGSPRLSAFPVALAAFDPSVLECARTSGAVAGLVAAGSMALGVALGHASGTRRYWGRGPLSALSKLPMVAGPLLIAPGVALMIGGPRGWEWLAARSTMGWSCEDLARRAALVWVGLAWGVPVVAMATEAALGRIDPSWIEAARAVGASRSRAWRDVTWPLLRPEVARASARVFALALVEPAAPMALGLRRTLAVAMLDAARRLDQPTRASALAAIAIAIAALARLAILGWGGSSPLRTGSEPGSFEGGDRPGRLRVLASMALLAGWAAIGAGPVAVLMARAFAVARDAGAGPWPDLLSGWLLDPESRAWAANAALVALLAVGLDLVILGTTGRMARRVAGVFEVVPPLAVGVGALALPWLLSTLGDRAGAPFGPWLGALAGELSPARAPGFLLIVAVAASRLPTLARSAGLAEERARPVLADAALLMGVSPRRSRRAGMGRGLGMGSARPALLAFAIASTALAPALLLAPGSERRTLAPAVLGWLLDPDAIDPRAAGPAFAILAIRLAGFAVASKGRSGPLGEWFRG